MNIDHLIRRLRHGAGSVASLAGGVAEPQARWKPAPGEWSILEVVCHLADEEARDFRVRLDLTLHHPAEPWPPIDPERWVTEERYLDRDLSEVLLRFRDERSRSVAWLEGLAGADWTRSYEHPTAGALTAADLLAAWVAHDLIHIRQITRLHRQYVERVAAPGARLDYAGRW